MLYQIRLKEQLQNFELKLPIVNIETKKELEEFKHSFFTLVFHVKQIEGSKGKQVLHEVKLKNESLKTLFNSEEQFQVLGKKALDKLKKDLFDSVFDLLKPLEENTNG